MIPVRRKPEAIERSQLAAVLVQGLRRAPSDGPFHIDGGVCWFPEGARALRKSAKVLARKLTVSGLKWPKVFAVLEGLARELKTPRRSKGRI